jgi:GcrA cell cycle regulator
LLFILSRLRNNNKHRGAIAMANPHNRFWDDERVKQLKQLHAEGLSCSLIAAKLGCGLSRNSIVGKLHRIGLRSVKPIVTKEKPAPRAHRRRPFHPVVIPFLPGERTMEQAQPSSPLNDADIPLARRRTLMELRHRDCRWSCGDPGASDFFFCGAPAVDGFPYCRDHCERAYDQPSRMSSGGPRGLPIRSEDRGRRRCADTTAGVR